MSDYDELTNLIAAYGHIYDDGRLEEWTELFSTARTASSARSSAARS
jgi:hypothetical protein